MNRMEIPLSDLRVSVYTIWRDEGFLLTCGDHSSASFNTMTIAWGGLGCMWAKPMAMVVVRPQRYTYEFIEKYPDFTICHFSPDYDAALDYCGTHSGRDVDKVAECALSPIPSVKVGSPGFEEADLILECSKMYYDDFEPEHFLAGFIAGNYPAKDYHRLYLGEIKAAYGTSQYRI